MFNLVSLTFFNSFNYTHSYSNKDITLNCLKSHAIGDQCDIHERHTKKNAANFSLFSFNQEDKEINFTRFYSKNMLTDTCTTKQHQFVRLFARNAAIIVSVYLYLWGKCCWYLYIISLERVKISR